MFDHLDDPTPYVPSGALRPAVDRRARSLKRRRRLLGSGLATVVLLVIGIVGAPALLDRKLDRVERIDVAGLRETTKPVDPQVVLFVGTDTDEGLDAPDPNRPPGSARTDTILLARIDPGNESVTLLSLNRDLWVDIPGYGPGRITTAYERGGPDLLIDTIHQVYGIEIDRYVETDFAGAVAIGDALGGLSFSFPYEVKDQSGLHVPAGCHTYRGVELLALGRARHLKYFDEPSGTWWSLDPTSDLGRAERAQLIGKAIVARLSELDASDPVELNRLVDAFARHVTLDQGTTSDELIGLFRAVSGSEVTSVRLPVADAVRNGADVLVVDPAAQAAEVEQFLGLDPTAPTGPTSTTTLGTAVTSTTTTSTTAATTTTVPSSTPPEAIPTPC